MSKVDVTISIVSYNSKNVLSDCIDSIIKSTKDIDTEIIVVDNRSQDGSAELVKKHFPFVNLIENTENVGFGKAHNQSFRLSKGKYFLILNPDTIIFPEAISKMVKFMDSHDHVGVVGCKIWWDDGKNFMFPDLKIHTLKTALLHFTPFCRYFPNSLISRQYWKSAYTLWNSKTPTIVDGITGGLMVVRREVFESVGFFDENFFLFFEEHDLLRRVKNAGWGIYYIPDARIIHYFEESCRNSSIDIGKVYMQSALYYYQKYYKSFGVLFLKSLMKINSAFLCIEKWAEKYFSKFLSNFEIITSNNESKMLITWDKHPGAVKYLVEISYNLNFVDRGGMYVKGETLSLKKNILKRLPNETGFLRVQHVYANNSTGKVIKVIKITSQQKATNINAQNKI